MTSAPVRVSVFGKTDLGLTRDHNEDTFLVADHIPEHDQYYVQTRRDEGEPYTVEYREGSAKAHFHTDIASPADVLAVFVAWARRDPEWKGAHNWRRLRL